MRAFGAGTRVFSNVVASIVEVKLNKFRRDYGVKMARGKTKIINHDDKNNLSPLSVYKVELKAKNYAKFLALI